MPAGTSHYKEGAGIHGVECLVDDPKVYERYVIIPQSIIDDLMEFATRAAKAFQKQPPVWIQNFTGEIDLTKKDYIREERWTASGTGGVGILQYVPGTGVAP